MIGYINGNTVLKCMKRTEIDQNTLMALTCLGAAAGYANLLEANKKFIFKGSSMDDFFYDVTKKIAVCGNKEAKEMAKMAQAYYCPESKLRKDMNNVINQFCLGVIMYRVEELRKFQAKWEFFIQDEFGRKYNNKTVYVNKVA